MCVYQCGKGTYDADALIDVLKGHFGCFGVCTDFLRNFGPQFASSKFAIFFAAIWISIELVVLTIPTVIQELNWQLNLRKD